MVTAQVVGFLPALWDTWMAQAWGSEPASRGLALLHASSLLLALCFSNKNFRYVFLMILPFFNSEALGRAKHHVSVKHFFDEFFISKCWLRRVSGLSGLGRLRAYRSPSWSCSSSASSSFLLVHLESSRRGLQEGVLAVTQMEFCLWLWSGPALDVAGILQSEPADRRLACVCLYFPSR